MSVRKPVLWKLNHNLTLKLYIHSRGEEFWLSGVLPFSSEIAHTTIAVGDSTHSAALAFNEQKSTYLNKVVSL